MATSTLDTITDSLVSLQREVNDIETVLSSHRQSIDSFDTSIDTLQNPPAGVPPQLLAWLSTHSIREVDSTLDTDLTTITSNIDTQTEDIAVLSSVLTQEITDRSTADADFIDVDVDLQAQITDNLAVLTQEINDRSALSVSVSEGLDTVNVRIDNLESDLADASTSSSSDSDTLSDQISTINASLQTAQTQIALLSGVGVDSAGALGAQITALTIIANDASTAVALETTNRVSADNTLQASINALSGSISGINSGLTDEKNAREAADLDIQSDVSVLNAEVGGIPGLITSETAARTAADISLQGDIDINTGDIAVLQTGLLDEVIDRSNADVALQSTVDGHTASIATNASGIAANTTGLTLVKAKFGVVKDGGGYITNWWVNDETTPPGAFKLRDLNNDLRLQNPNYVGKYFPPVSVVSFQPPVTYDADWGGATTNDFHGGDGNDYTRNVKVYSTFAVGITGSVFKGVDYSAGGDLNRLGQVLTTFLVDISGGVNRYLSLWMRLKNAPADATGRWFPVALADNTLPAQRTYERIRVTRAVQIVVTANQVIEFGLTVLNTQDATISSATNDIIYGGSATITALNMVTIA